MKIKMLTSIAGADFSLSAGDETERFTNKEAVRMIKADMAVPVAKPKPETAVRTPAREKRG